MGYGASFSKGQIINTRKSSYKLLQLLSSGGMGEIWLGTDLSTDDLVAIKIPKNNKIAVQKARFEGKLLSSIKHQNIVKLIDFYDSGIPIIVEEFINGMTLNELVEIKGPLDNNTIMAILTSLLTGIDYLHSLNIVHRDIKPKNIMINNNLDPRSLKIIDLGTATYYNVKGIGEIVFSQGGYAAPEQYRFHALPQSDLWSVAAVALFLLTGNDPIVYIGENYYNTGLIWKVIPSEIAESSESYLKYIIRKGMAWNIIDRFLSAREFLDYINGYFMKYDSPVLEIMGIVIPIKTPIVIVGRKEIYSDGDETKVSLAGTIVQDYKKIDVIIEGDITYIYIADPYRWISSRHFEIRKTVLGWCIRDLGSTNRTAIVSKDGIKEIWIGRRRVSPCYQLDERNVILIAYGNSLQNTPYVTAVFRKH